MTCGWGQTESKRTCSGPRRQCEKQKLEEKKEKKQEVSTAPLPVERSSSVVSIAEIIRKTRGEGENQEEKDNSLRKK